MKQETKKIVASCLSVVFMAAIFASVAVDKASAVSVNRPPEMTALYIKKTASGNLYIHGWCKTYTSPVTLTKKCAGQPTKTQVYTWSGKHYISQYKVTPGKICSIRLGNRTPVRISVRQADKYKEGITRVYSK